MNITFKSVNKNDFSLIHKWCQQKFVYEWFEQRILSYEEIVTKYTNKLNDNKQDLYIIQYDNKNIGLMQIYKCNMHFNEFNNLYEYDLFIGEETYLDKGIGTKLVNIINEMIYTKYKANAIILRPFKRNIRAIKCYQKCHYQIIDEYQGTDTLGNPEIIIVMLNKKEH